MIDVFTDGRATAHEVNYSPKYMSAISIRNEQIVADDSIQIKKIRSAKSINKDESDMDIRDTPEALITESINCRYNNKSGF